VVLLAQGKTRLAIRPGMRLTMRLNLRFTMRLASREPIAFSDPSGEPRCRCCRGLASLFRASKEDAHGLNQGRLDKEGEVGDTPNTSAGAWRDGWPISTVLSDRPTVQAQLR